MKRIGTILTILLLTLVCKAHNMPDNLGAKELLIHETDSFSSHFTDSVMKQVISCAAAYEYALTEYDAEIYIKGHSEILKKNYLLRFGHLLFPVDRKNENMIFELITDSHFKSPNSFIHNFKAVNGNSIPNSQKQQEALTFLNVNIYSSTIYNGGIVMPTAKNASRLYIFTMENIEYTADGTIIYKIRFVPKQRSQKLVCGNLYIIDKRWTIDRINLNGRFSFAEFSLDLVYNRNNYYYLLPQKADLFLRYSLLKNTIVSSYHASFVHNNLVWRKRLTKRTRKPLDLTNYYKLSTDTIPFISDSNYWNHKRDIPLSVNERDLYQTYKQKNAFPSDTNTIRYLKVTEKLTNTINFDIRTTRVKYSGLLNPFQLGFSGRNGITYRQQIRISKTFSKDRQLRFRPEIGFVFKRKEVFFKVAGDWEYKPERMGVLSLTIANANQGYSSEIMKEINEQLKDSSFNIDDMNLKYFKHYYIDLRNNYELRNGLLFSAGLSYHRRIPAEKPSDKEVGDDITNLINEQYNDFIPAIGLTYTPRQYFKMDGYRKEYAFSYYPTLSIELARAIPDIMGSVGDYGRVEMDIHQNIPLGLTRYLRYHLSGGVYTSQKSTYFADFRYFTRRNFPDSWNDHFGGVFNQLSGSWYNASDKYMQAHLMYESPFILFQLFKKDASRHVLSERFYFSRLWTPVLPSYTEIGYGFGNHLFNIAVFAGFNKWEYQSIGLKFDFELFQ